MMLPAAIVCALLAQPVTEPVPVDAVLEAAAEAYRQAPTAERVTLTVREGGRERTEGLVLRLAPAKPGSSRAGLLGLELGKFRVWVGDGRLVVAHADVHDAVVVLPAESRSVGDVLEAALPSLLLPELAALDGGLRNGELGPMVPEVAWDSAEVTTLADRGTLAAVGVTDRGGAELVLDVETGRIVSFAAPLVDSDARIEVRCRPIEPGDPESWRIETAGLAKVATVRELLASPAPIAVGGVLSAFPVEEQTGEPWSIDAMFTGSAAPECAALLVCRAGCDADPLDEADATLTRLEQELTRPAGPMLPAQVRRLAWRPIVVGEPGEDDRARWADRAPLVAWSPGRTIDRLAPESQAVVVVVGEDRRVAAIIDASDAAEIGRAVRALFPEPVDPRSEE